MCKKQKAIRNIVKAVTWSYKEWRVRFSLLNDSRIDGFSEKKWTIIATFITNLLQNSLVIVL